MNRLDWSERPLCSFRQKYGYKYKRHVHHPFARSIENIVSESVADDTNVSIPCRSQVLIVSYGTL